MGQDAPMARGGSGRSARRPDTSTAGVAPLLHPAESTAAPARLGLLVEASARMGDTLDLRVVAQGLAETVVPGFAAQCSVDLVESLFHPERAVTGEPSRLMCRVAHVETTGPPAPGSARPTTDWLSYLPASPGARALADGTPQLAPVGGGAATALLVPLVARGRVLGLASFLRDGDGDADGAGDRAHGGGGPRFGEADLAVAEELAARAAMALDNVRLYEEARATAVALQRSLLPQVHPRITGVRTAHRYLPGSLDTEVGGDWFDVLPLSSGRVAFVIGDVMGRGVRAAAAMGQLRTAVRMLAVLDPMPDEVLSHLDDLALGTSQVQLATCVYAVFDPVSRQLCFATAGHPPPLLRDPDGSTRMLPQPAGAPLGVGGVPYESTTVEVPDGARLLLYTDGLVESRTHDIGEGLHRLTAAFQTAPDDLPAACDHILAALDRADGHVDDVALLVARLSGLDEWRVASWRLEGRSEEIGGVRAEVRDVLGGWQLPDLVDAGGFAASELLTNAVRHGRGPVELQLLLLDEIVTISVADGDTRLPRLRRTSVEDEGGRGLHLVSLLTQRWGARATAGGKVVWCQLPRAAPTGAGAGGDAVR
jgi:serine phosphatase RsbU (regulator of sigma subunit)/anti-sigma regulatory factor (Ser/Thr protein kinase)